MKKWIQVILAAVLVLSFVQFTTTKAEASSFREVKVVNSASGVSVYEKATKNSTYIGQLAGNTFVTQFSTTNGWAYVESTTHKGYVDASFLSTPKHSVKIASSKSGLVVKSAPSRNANTSATLQYNMIVKDYGPVGGGWSFVQYGNVTGYVVSSFIGSPKTKTAYINSGSGAVARNIASPSGASVGTLAHGTKVTVYTTLAGWSFVKTGNVEGYVAASFLSNKAPVKPQITGGLLPKYDDLYEYSLETADEYDSMYFYFNKISNSRILIDSHSNGTLFEYRVLNNMMNITLVEDLTFAVPLPLYEGKTWSGTTDGVPLYYTVEYLNGYADTEYMYFTDVVKIAFNDASKELYGEIHLAPGYGVVWFELNDALQIILEDVF